MEKTPTKTTSKLYITRAVKADSGNYTCAPKFSRPDSVTVHVVNGEFFFDMCCVVVLLGEGEGVVLLSGVLSSVSALLS